MLAVSGSVCTWSIIIAEHAHNDVIYMNQNNLTFYNGRFQYVAHTEADLYTYIS